MYYLPWKINAIVCAKQFKKTNKNSTNSATEATFRKPTLRSSIFDLNNYQKKLPVFRTHLKCHFMHNYEHLYSHLSKNFSVKSLSVGVNNHPHTVVCLAHGAIQPRCWCLHTVVRLYDWGSHSRPPVTLREINRSNSSEPRWALSDSCPLPFS